MLNFAKHHALLCCNHATYCSFELVSCAKQENILWSNVSFILSELQLFVQSRVFFEYYIEMKLPSS